MSDGNSSSRESADVRRGNIAQARRDADDKRSADIARDRQKRLEADAVKTSRLREQRLAKEAADRIADKGAAAPEQSAKGSKKRNKIA
jgi:hypothetical protein